MKDRGMHAVEREKKRRDAKALLVLACLFTITALVLLISACSGGQSGSSIGHNSGTDIVESSSSPSSNAVSSQDSASPASTAETSPEPELDKSEKFVAENPDVEKLDAGTVLTKKEVRLYGEDACFTVKKISDAVFKRMKGLSFGDDCTVPRSDLRYIRVLHKNAKDKIKIGELVMNKSVAKTVCGIFRKLYKADYPIEKMHLVDDYGAVDRKSMADDNTSAFNYRLVAGTNHLSYHALGLAIDINTFYNPYCILSTGYVSPPGAEAYADRDADFDYKIERGDLCYRLFTEAGFNWGGDWNDEKDYQHFQMGTRQS